MSSVGPSSTLYLTGEHALALGDRMYLRYDKDKAISCIISCVLYSSQLDKGPILAVTGGDGKIGGDMCTVQGDRVGCIISHFRGLNIIDLGENYRSYVCNLIRSQTSQECIPFIYKVTLNALLHQLVLCHTGASEPPKLLKINGKERIDGLYQPFIQIGDADKLPFGTLITGIQRQGTEGENTRQLPAYGLVSDHREISGKISAIITMLTEAIKALQNEDGRFRGKEISIVTPICQPETEEKRSCVEEEAAGEVDVDVDGVDDTDTSGLASVDSVASITSAEEVAGAVAQGKGDNLPDQKESGYLTERLF